MAVLDKGLLAKARNLAAAADRMAELAAAPETDPAYVKAARRQDVMQKARLEKDMQQSDREFKIMHKHMRAEDVLVTNARRKQIELENKRCHNEVKLAANTIQRQFRNDPVLKRSKAQGERQQRLMGGGQCILSGSSSAPSLPRSERSIGAQINECSPVDEVLARAKKLNAKVWREFG